MQPLKKDHHAHESLYAVTTHIDLAIYETSSKIGTCMSGRFILEYWYVDVEMDRTYSRGWYGSTIRDLSSPGDAKVSVTFLTMLDSVDNTHD